MPDFAALGEYPKGLWCRGGGPVEEQPAGDHQAGDCTAVSAVHTGHVGGIELKPGPERPAELEQLGERRAVARYLEFKHLSLQWDLVVLGASVERGLQLGLGRVDWFGAIGFGLCGMESCVGVGI
jgi:hypothetical protein